VVRGVVEIKHVLDFNEDIDLSRVPYIETTDRDTRHKTYGQRTMIHRSWSKNQRTKESQSTDRGAWTMQV